MIDLLFWRSYINDSAIFLFFVFGFGLIGVSFVFIWCALFYIGIWIFLYWWKVFILLSFFSLFLSFFFFFFVASSSFLVYFMEKVPLKFHISCKTTFCVGHINGSDSFDLLEGLFIFVSLSKFMDKRLRPICEKDIFLVKFPWKGSSI